MEFFPVYTSFSLNFHNKDNDYDDDGDEGEEAFW